jgi:single-strand DNA-binding protein
MNNHKDNHMATLNHCFISVNLTKDPEQRFTKSGMALASFSIAVNRSYQLNGAWQKEVSFIDCKAWGELAQRVSELSKGTPVILQGELRQERWEASDGSQRSRLVIIADRVTAVSV